MTSRRFLAATLALLPTLSCGPVGPTPVYDSDTGLRGVTTDEGALAGTWGMVVEFALKVNIAGIEKNGGSQGLRLLTRTWDAASRTYKDSFQWCNNEVFEVEGTKTAQTRSTLATLSHVEFESDVDHREGAFSTKTVLDLWGLHNLPDPMETTLPEASDYTQSPQSDWVEDEDHDSHPGVTSQMTGVVTADVYVVSRSAYELKGTVLSTDRVQGLVHILKSEQNVLDSTNRLASGKSRPTQDPDPLNTWFDMARMPTGTTCDQLIQAQQDGKIANRRPFKN